MSGACGAVAVPVTGRRRAPGPRPEHPANLQRAEGGRLAVGVVAAATAVPGSEVLAAPRGAAAPVGRAAVMLAIAVVVTTAVGAWLARRAARARVTRRLSRLAARRRRPARATPRLGGRPAPQWFADRAGGMALAVPADVLWARLVLIVPVVIGGAAVVGGVGAALAAAGGAAVAPFLAHEVLGDRGDRLVDAELPALLDHVAGGLRSGLALPAALGEALPRLDGPLRDDVAALCASLDAGAPVAVALARWRRRRSTTGVALAVSALTLSSVLGGRSRPLDGVASTMRDRLAVEREVRAAVTQARASAGVLVVLPWAFTAYAAVQDPGSLAFFADGPLGAACLLAGLSLDVAGAWIMLRLVGRAS